MLRFAEASPFLVPQTSIEALLASANASTAHDRDDEALVEAILNAPEFDHYYEEIVEAHAGELTLHYNGNLHNGEIIDRAFSGAIDNFDFQIVSRINERIGLLVNSEIELDILVAYDDLAYAMYDREQGTWFGAERKTSTITRPVDLELYLELDVATGKIATSELIQNDIRIH